MTPHPVPEHGCPSPFKEMAQGMLVALRSARPLTREEFEPGTVEVAGVRLHETARAFFGWGHQDKTRFAVAVNRHLAATYRPFQDTAEDDVTVKDVAHVWAVTLLREQMDPFDLIEPIEAGDWRIAWTQTPDGEPITRACPTAFPITVVDL